MQRDKKVQTAKATANTRSNESESLVNIKGLGNPPLFNGDCERFTEWLWKTRRFLFAPCGSASRPVAEWVDDQDNVIMSDALAQQFGSQSDERATQVTSQTSVSIGKHVCDLGEWWTLQCCVLCSNCHCCATRSSSSSVNGWFGVGAAAS